MSDLEFSHNQRVNTGNGKTLFELIMGYNPMAIPEFITSSKFPHLETRLWNLQTIQKEALASHEMAQSQMADRITRTFRPFQKVDKVWLEAKNLNVGGIY